MLQVGVRHRRVFALDVHTVNLAGMDRVHDLDDGKSAHGIELLPPEPLESAPHVVATDRLIIQQENRDQASVRSALHVVLAAQRMQARARTTELAPDKRQRYQAA